jgi:hypothetical protein
MGWAKPRMPGGLIKVAHGLSSTGFGKLYPDPAVYMRRVGEQEKCIFTHVDDGLCFGPRGAAHYCAERLLSTSGPQSGRGALSLGTAHRKGPGGVNGKHIPGEVDRGGVEAV